MSKELLLFVLWICRLFTCILKCNQLKALHLFTFKSYFVCFIVSAIQAFYLRNVILLFIFIWNKIDLEPEFPPHGYLKYPTSYIVFPCLSWNSICCWLSSWLIIKDHLIENYRVMLFKISWGLVALPHMNLLCYGHQGALFV